MIKLISVLGLVAGLSQTVYAQNKNVVLSEREVKLSVNISREYMKLSSAGYVSPVVKVLVPELADVTILNHRNEGESAPCLATFQVMDPEEVIQNNPGIEKIKFNIKLIKNTRKVMILPVNPEDPIFYCEVKLSEHVQGDIRGFEFVHLVTTEVDKRNVGDCR